MPLSEYTGGYTGNIQYTYHQDYWYEAVQILRDNNETKKKKGVDMDKKSDWKLSSKAIRKLFKNIPEEISDNMNRLIEYKFGAIWNSRYNYWQVWNGVAENIIATVKPHEDKMVIRYRESSWYADLIKNIEYEKETVHIPSDNLHRHKRLPRNLQPHIESAISEVERQGIEDDNPQRLTINATETQTFSLDRAGYVALSAWILERDLQFTEVGFNAFGNFLEYLTAYGSMQARPTIEMILPSEFEVQGEMPRHLEGDVRYILRQIEGRLDSLPGEPQFEQQWTRATSSTIDEDDFLAAVDALQANQLVDRRPQTTEVNQEAVQRMAEDEAEQEAAERWQELDGPDLLI